MIHKTALFVASVAAALTLAFALAAAGFAPGATSHTGAAFFARATTNSSTGAAG